MSKSIFLNSFPDPKQQGHEQEDLFQDVGHFRRNDLPFYAAPFLVQHQHGHVRPDRRSVHQESRSLRHASHSR